ncbi:hypothetical protein [Stenotrophomonas maltophilia]|uniref:hypothetical protein n=1 Tax=Stenotrophomonas maltophilia TaxID=40324 RepID=UPI00066BC16C|nr:hypothetical protein [Stenotrophomonas maltophilia]
MKKMIAVVAVLAGSLALNAPAQEVDYVGASPKVLAEANAQAADLPAGVQLVELERWKFKEDTFSGRPLNTPGGMIYPGKKQGTLGFISYFPFEGSVTMYSCVNNNWLDTFSSLDANCEGHMHSREMPITGYIASTQLPGTVPLYRCMRGGLKPNNWADHFDTLDANCEGVKYPVNEGIMGYIWL